MTRSLLDLSEERAGPLIGFLDKLSSINLEPHLLDPYISLFANRRNSSTEDFVLDTEVEKFICSTKKVLLLSANAGSGKSEYCKRLARSLWQELEKEKLKPIPIYIDLGMLVDVKHNLIEKVLSQKGLSVDEIALLLSSQSLLLILEGYDELNKFQNLYITNNLSKLRCKVIITCRVEYLYQVQNYPMYFMPYEGEVAQYHLFDEIKIKQLNQQQITSYLKYWVESKKTSWNLQNYQDWLEKITGIEELIEIPFFLNVVLEKLPIIVAEFQSQTEEDSGLSKIQQKLYEVCIQEWFIRQEAKLKLSGIIKESEDIKLEFWAYAKKIARELYERKVTQIECQVGSDLFDEVPKIGHLLFDDSNPRMAILKNACLIREVGIDQYRFFNQVFIEYFATRSFSESSSLPKDDAALPEKDRYLSAVDEKSLTLPVTQQDWLTDYFNSHLFTQEPDTLRFLADSVEVDEGFKKSLFKRIEASKHTEEIKIAAANAITILNAAKQAFSGMDLSGIRVPRAVLINGIFHHSDLSFADLTGVNLANANLCNCNLQQAKMDKVTFGEYPSLLGHTDAVRAIDISTDDRMLASGSEDGTVRVWEIKTYKGYTKPVLSVRFSKDNNYIFSAIENLIIFWSAKTWERKMFFSGHNGFIRSIEFNYDGKYFISASDDQTIIVRDLKSLGTIKAKLIGHTDSVSSVSFCYNRSYIISSSLDKTIRIWSLKTCLCINVLTGHEREVTCVCISPDDRDIISGEFGGRLRVWSMSTKECLKVLKGHGNDVYSLRISNNSKYMISASRDNSIHIWDMLTYDAIKVLAWPSTLVFCAILTSDNSKIISCGWNKSIRTWDMLIDVKSHLQLMEGHVSHVFSVCLSQNNFYIISGSADTKIRIWNLSNGRCVNTIDMPKLNKGTDYAVTTVAVTSDDRYIVSGSRDKNIRVWEISSGLCVKVLTGHQGEISCVCICPDGYHILTGSASRYLKSDINDPNIRIWDLVTGRCVKVLKGHSAGIYSIAVNSDNQYIVSGSADCTIRMWSTETHETIRMLKGHEGEVYSVNISQDSRYIISGSEDTTIRIWDTLKGTCIKLIYGIGYKISCVIFSHDSRYIISGSEDFVIRIWDTMSGKCLHDLIGHAGGVTSVSRSIDNKTLVSASGDKSIKIWREVNGKWLLVRSINATREELTCKNADFKGVSLLEDDKTLLEQRGATFSPKALVQKPIIHFNYKHSIKIRVQKKQLNLSEIANESKII